jgi:hypothetical protein
MIGSALAAGDTETAHATFRTTILEYVYEKIAEYGDADIRFVNSRDLHRVGEQLGKYYDTDQGCCLALDIATGVTLSSSGPRIFAPVSMIDSGDVRQDINDHIQTTVMAVVEYISGNVYAEVYDALKKMRNKPGKSGRLTFNIVVDLFEFDLSTNGKTVTARARIPILCYWVGAN